MSILLSDNIFAVVCSSTKLVGKNQVNFPKKAPVLVSASIKIAKRTSSLQRDCVTSPGGVTTYIMHPSQYTCRVRRRHYRRDKNQFDRFENNDRRFVETNRTREYNNTPTNCPFDGQWFYHAIRPVNRRLVVGAYSKIEKNRRTERPAATPV